MSQTTRGRILFSYVGTGYYGWQKQPNVLTIQEELEKTLSKLFDAKVPLMASGRTDAGVHAYGQVAHFNAPKQFSRFKNLKKSLNSLLPPTIVVRDVYEAPEDFHAMISVVQKTYVYKILRTKTPSAFLHDRALWRPQDLNLDLLNQISAVLIGEHDFASFQTQGTDVATTVRKIFAVKWVQPRENLVEFRITGSGFLKQMVRNIVGTLLDLHDEKGLTNHVEEMTKILAAKSRQAAGSTAPAHGLYLHHVVYPKELDNRCRKL